MDKTSTIYKGHGEGILMDNLDYFKYIFKKTEKIVCAVFYILRINKDIDRNDIVVKDLETTAQALINRSIHGLQSGEEQSGGHLRELSFSLVALESKLRILNATNQLPSSLLAVFLNEIDTVLRTLRGYLDRTPHNPLFDTEVGESAQKSGQRERFTSHQRVAASSGAVGSTLSPRTSAVDRRERILGVLKEKAPASIKDVSDVIKDCSEKTIQRELNTLIKDNLAVREGERRWSRYSLAR